MAARESTVEKKARQFAEELGYIQFKFVSPAQPGVPDRLFISHHGHTLYMEFKREGEKPTEKQMKMLKRLRKQNAPCCWVDNIKTARAMLGDFLTHREIFNKLWPL